MKRKISAFAEIEAIDVVESTTNTILADQQALHTCVISFVNDDTSAQMALGFRCLLTHQVTHASAAALNFPLASHRKTLLGAGVGLHFRHDKNI